MGIHGHGTAKHCTRNVRTFWSAKTRSKAPCSIPTRSRSEYILMASNSTSFASSSSARRRSSFVSFFERALRRDRSACEEAQVICEHIKSWDERQRPRNSYRIPFSTHISRHAICHSPE